MTNPIENKSSPPSSQRLQFYGGMWGLMIPFLVLFAGIIALALTGNALPDAFWVPTLAAILLAIALAKNKEACANSLVKGMASEMVAIMLMAWFLAGVVGQIMKSTGLIEGLVWLTTSIGLEGRYFPAITFLIGSLISTATGTALGTVIALTPVLYPVGVAIGANPAVMLASIVSAGYFGDNLAPISDTTIASAYTQGVDVSVVVKSRLKYALIAAAFAATLFVIFGGSGAAPTAEKVVLGSPKGLIMLLAPALLIGMMYRGKHLIVSLVFTVAFGLALGLVMGQIGLSDIFNVDMNTFSSHGIIVDGMMGLVGIVVFALLLMALVRLLEDGGFFEFLIDKLSKYTDTPRSAELVVYLINIVLSILTVANTIVIVMEGPLAKKILVEKHGIARDRSANILDCTACGAMCLIPYGFAPLLAYQFATSSGAVVAGSVVDVCLYSFHGYALLLVMLISILSGWSRKFEPELKVSK